MSFCLIGAVVIIIAVVVVFSPINKEKETVSSRETFIQSLASASTKPLAMKIRKNTINRISKTR